jgi:hypothetical protein
MYASSGARQLSDPFVKLVPVQGLQVVGTTVVPIGAAPQPPSAAGGPQLTYRGGPLIARIRAYGLYWGSAWNTPMPGGTTNQPVTRQALDAYLADLVSGVYIDIFAEYSTATTTISRGAYLGSAIIGPDPGAQVTDADIQAQIQQRLGDGSIPAWDANTLYCVFLPSGTTVQQGGQASCQVFCGYHDAILDPNTNAPVAYYGVLPYPDCGGCAQAADGTPMSTFDALTTVTSHELAEAITDPVPGIGWYDDQNGEIGDICAWQLAMLDIYTVQQEWSNNAGTCVGPTPVGM